MTNLGKAEPPLGFTARTLRRGEWSRRETENPVRPHERRFRQSSSDDHTKRLVRNFETINYQAHHESPNPAMHVVTGTMRLTAIWVLAVPKEINTFRDLCLQGAFQKLIKEWLT